MAKNVRKVRFSYHYCTNYFDLRRSGFLSISIKIVSYNEMGMLYLILESIRVFESLYHLLLVKMKVQFKL